MSLYQKRGASAQKEEVHAATVHLDQGLYPHAFCKIYPDYLGGDEKFVSVMHADGAGTKSILAYLYWKETGDVSVWKGIAQDAIVMNLDDLLCVGIYDQLVFNSTIDRNKHLIPGSILSEIIQGSQDLFDQLREFGVNIHYLGGETADVGDVVRTIAVNGTMTARWEKTKLITNDSIAAGNVIVGLAGFGQSNYEDAYNSGIASNGLTSARHDMLHKTYAENFSETYDPNTDPEVVYIGKYKMTDPVNIVYHSKTYKTDIGKLLLSPTRTFAPLIRLILEEYRDSINGMIHCSGGGQTKCLKYISSNLKIIKNNLFDPPPVFKLIRESSGANAREMYQVFNMGCRMELYTNEHDAQKIIELAHSFDIEARVIGHVEHSQKKGLEIHTSEEIIQF